MSPSEVTSSAPNPSWNRLKSGRGGQILHQVLDPAVESAAAGVAMMNKAIHPEMILFMFNNSKIV
jgi:hypothetical protein